jgi:hypothetical protein
MSSEVKSQPLDLVLLALDPVLVTEHGARAVVGFAASQFIAAPGERRNFRVKSKANNLLVSGRGFLAAKPDGPLTTDFSEDGLATLTVFFKVVDPEAEMALAFKHWKTTATACHMTIVINDGTPIYRHVDATEAASGDDNLVTITLRNDNYASAEFFDYLVLGLNKIVITVEPSRDPQVNEAVGGYALRALALV